MIPSLNNILDEFLVKDLILIITKFLSCKKCKQYENKYYDDFELLELCDECGICNDCECDICGECICNCNCEEYWCPDCNHFVDSITDFIVCSRCKLKICPTCYIWIGNNYIKYPSRECRDGKCIIKN